MPLARWSGVVQDAAGNALSGASIEVRNEVGGALAPLFTDREGTVGLTNPFSASDATAWFHVAGGAYRIKATLGTFEQEWRFVPIGTAGELDAEDLISDIDDALNTAVRTNEQDLTEAQQAQALLNIGMIPFGDIVRKDVDQSAAAETAARKANLLRNILQQWEAVPGGKIVSVANQAQILYSNLGDYVALRMRGVLRPVNNGVNIQAEFSANGGTSWLTGTPLSTLSGSLATGSAVSPATGTDTSKLVLNRGHDIDFNNPFSFALELSQFNKPITHKHSLVSNWVNSAQSLELDFRGGGRIIGGALNAFRIRSDLGAIDVREFILEGVRG